MNMHMHIAPRTTSLLLDGLDGVRLQENEWVCMPMAVTATRRRSATHFITLSPEADIVLRYIRGVKLCARDGVLPTF